MGVDTGDVQHVPVLAAKALGQLAEAFGRRNFHLASRGVRNDTAISVCAHRGAYAVALQIELVDVLEAARRALDEQDISRRRTTGLRAVPEETRDEDGMIPAHRTAAGAQQVLPRHIGGGLVDAAGGFVARIPRVQLDLDEIG